MKTYTIRPLQWGPWHGSHGCLKCLNAPFRITPGEDGEQLLLNLGSNDGDDVGYHPTVAECKQAAAACGKSGLRTTAWTRRRRPVLKTIMPKNIPLKEQRHER